MAKVEVSCTFEIGKMLKDLLWVEVSLSEAVFVRRCGSWDVEVTLPPATTAGSYDDEEQLTMHCGTFEVVARADIEASAGDDPKIFSGFEELLSVARDVADTVLIDQATQGFAGATPKIVKHSLTIGGVACDSQLANRYLIGTLFVGHPATTYEAIRAAVEDGERPSTSRLLLAQATRWGLADPSASKAAALTLAATACEVAIKSLISKDTRGALGSLGDVLAPEGRQAPLSSQALLEHAVPLVLGRSVSIERPKLLKDYKRLVAQRDAVVHRGEQIDEAEFRPHLHTARRLIGWLEATEGRADRRDSE